MTDLYKFCLAYRGLVFWSPLSPLLVRDCHCDRQRLLESEFQQGLAGEWSANDDITVITTFAPPTCSSDAGRLPNYDSAKLFKDKTFSCLSFAESGKNCRVRAFQRYRNFEEGPDHEWAFS
jgi:hypothetical protein